MSSRICLVNTPYSSLSHPSISLGIIKNYIMQYGHHVDVIYANLEFSKVIGLQEYDAIDNSHFEQLIGEWTFSHIAFPEKPQSDELFFNLFFDLDDNLKSLLLRVKKLAENYITQLAQRIIESNVSVVGCTSTFQQNCASLALLRLIKTKNPDIITLMGGANCEGIMGKTISDNFKWVDFVFSGECDDVIGGFVDKLVNNEKIGHHNLPFGFISQKLPERLELGKKASDKVPRRFLEDMTNVETPNYDDYFEALAKLGLTKNISPGLLAETSRGCWWGAKKHCTFCGLNGESMVHRSKTPDTVIAELNEQSKRYNVNKFEIVDNILPMEYFSSVVPELKNNTDYQLFYETKSNLKKEHIQQLSDAGIQWIQPGFESLSDEFLRIINKGVTGIQNISALKWCRNFGVNVTWNLLCGAPNEQQHWFEDMAEILPLISHFQPPYKQLIPIRYARFSPYFKTPEKYNISLAPVKSYQYVYPLSQTDLFNIAYFFEDKNEECEELFHISPLSQLINVRYQTLQTAIEQWHEAWNSSLTPLLFMSNQQDNVVLIDTRTIATRPTHTLNKLESTIYRLCEEPLTMNRIMSKIMQDDTNVTEAQIVKSMKTLVDNKITLFLSNCYLSLAFTGVTKALPEAKLNPSGFIHLQE